LFGTLASFNSIQTIISAFGVKTIPTLVQWF